MKIKLSKHFSPFRRFRRDDSGATAIEFGLLAIPFIMLIFAILETTLSFTAQQVMSNAVDNLGRQIRTGQLVPATTDRNQFRAMLCDELQLMMPAGCPNLDFDLRAYNRFSDVPTTIPMATPTRLDTSGFTYNPGESETINHLRVFYGWPIYTDIMKQYLAGLDDGRTLLYTSATWKNEPF